jgi:hypothetical protein
LYVLSANRLIGIILREVENRKLGRAGKIALYIVGILVLLGGLMFFIGAGMLPVFFAGPYMILGFMIIVAGCLLMYAGHRVGQRKYKQIER